MHLAIPTASSIFRTYDEDMKSQSTDEGSVATDDSVRYQLVHVFAQVDRLIPF
jgi:hypothetical protein